LAPLLEREAVLRFGMEVSKRRSGGNRLIEPYDGAAGALERSDMTMLLAEFVAETPATLIPGAAKSSARLLILDTIGVSLLASTHPVGEIVSRMAKAALGLDARSSVFGSSGLMSSPGAAAHANGVMANALDYDAGSHLPTHILPAVLAIAECDGFSGAEVTTAFILAHEAAAALTRVIDATRKEKRGPTYRGWWHVGLIGPIAAALAICRLRRATREETRSAIGIATASSAGFRRNMGTMTKALHSGNAARAGIEAQYLAHEGFTSDESIIEGSLGFVSTITLPGEADVGAVARTLGKTFELERFPGVKRFPAVSPSHGVISAAIDIARRPGFDARSVDRIEADFRSFSLEKTSVASVEDAGFCAPYQIASSLIHGDFGPNELRSDRLMDPRVIELSKKVEQIPSGSDLQNVVRVWLNGGEVLVAQGTGEKAFHESDVEQKFRRCAEAAIAERGQIDEILERVQSLDRQVDVHRLMTLCRGGC
jgi:2-methylcitrate dehydratase PrpD